MHEHIIEDGRGDPRPGNPEPFGDSIIADGPGNDWGITPEGTALGHRYVMGNVNAYCPQCTDEQGVCVLDCDYDLDK